MSQTLGVLDVRRNNYSGPLPDVFPITCNLKTLDLNENALTDRIPKSLTNCRAMEVLDLGNNQILDIFPLLLTNILTFHVLVLRSDKFRGHIECPENIGAWPVIQIVDVASNNFSSELPKQCLTKWHGMMAVKGYTHLQLNHLRFNFFKFNPSLYYQDALTVTNKGLEMELEMILTVFTSIDFSSNQFCGEIPIELGQLKSLYVLNLSKNALGGQILSSLGNLQQLESLDFSNNSLNGAIPTSLTNLNFLSFLNFSHNQLSGKIPTGYQI
ncbi:receptor-like protein 33 [Ziziphus jujuba]|uniref:Receptor-like protein 33 n=1 Tax=Ziziphus jujuba TaxID=326968 RepID=A0A6P6GKU4_ZIZJJ|nr:receptor-like protein 33 [Ziziphus jujuba]